MRSGEAFWIFTKGASDFEGPLRVETPLQQGLILGRGRVGVILRNQSPHPLNPLVEHVTGATPGVPLNVVVRTLGDPASPIRPVAIPKPTGSWAQELPTLESGTAIAIPFENRAAEMNRHLQGSIIKVTTDLGTITWLPVVGIRDDLTE